jgi:spermidine/putrescine transport system ATP-binding protein
MRAAAEQTAAERQAAPVEAAPSAVELINITRRFGDFTALAGVSLTVRRGEFFSLLGPSGCGKTTLLRLIAGLDLPDSGTLRISGRDASNVPAHRRPVNTVFQSYALFPHLTVRENVAFGLRMKKVPASDLDRRVARAMELVEITDFASRKPAQLSGGQKQRVALARAIVNEPEVLLLDEPLGALDLKLRKQLQLDLHALQRRLGITFVYVTHDQDEALVMSDQVAVMNAGRVEQLGGAEEIYERPRTRFVAQFLGSCNLLEGTVSRADSGALWVRTPLGEVEACVASGARKPGERCTLAIRPEKVSLASDAAERLPNSFAVRITDTVYTGSDTEYSLDASGVMLKARLLNSLPGRQNFFAGQNAAIHLPPAALTLLEE